MIEINRNRMYLINNQIGGKVINCRKHEVDIHTVDNRVVTVNKTTISCAVRFTSKNELIRALQTTNHSEIQNNNRKRGRPRDTNSKSQKAVLWLQKHPTCQRKDFVQFCVSDLGLSEKGAATYYVNARKQLKIVGR